MSSARKYRDRKTATECDSSQDEQPLLLICYNWLRSHQQEMAVDTGGPEPKYYRFVNSRWKPNLSSGAVDLGMRPHSTCQNLPNALKEQDRRGQACLPSWDVTSLKR